jgi:hypothetical protein
MEKKRTQIYFSRFLSRLSWGTYRTRYGERAAILRPPTYVWNLYAKLEFNLTWKEQ